MQQGKQLGELENRINHKIRVIREEKEASKVMEEPKSRLAWKIINADAYLVEFRGEDNRFVHPMYFLKFAIKFGEVLGNAC